LGINAIAKETGDKTIDFLVAKPTNRFNILAQKLLASLSLIIATNVLFLLTTTIFANYSTNNLNIAIFAKLSSSMFIVQIIFLALGILISVFIKKIKNSTAVSLPIVFGFYIVGAFSSIFNSELLRYLSPLKYFDPSYTITNANFELKYLVLSFAIVVICLSVSFIKFNNKDISSTN
jgi:ABC-2 type transport system permease protein